MTFSTAYGYCQLQATVSFSFSHTQSLLLKRFKGREGEGRPKKVISHSHDCSLMSVT
ncbi:uncharacterized protein G2W53_043636 [Senna tora]|uniref:Uncharacterized protein n=1 Tax=Senna tora TaxID=362788 RepID=A0A834SLJ2_9FABA|nr:uncharacterized protein G2W53_043636 [Senna tora]